MTEGIVRTRALTRIIALHVRVPSEFATEPAAVCKRRGVIRARKGRNLSAVTDQLAASEKEMEKEHVRAIRIHRDAITIVMIVRYKAN